MIFLCVASAARGDEESVNNAMLLCQVFDNTGLLSEPCAVSGWSSSVDVKIDTSGGEALEICDGVVKMIHSKGVEFEDGWKVKIYSPFSGDSTLAQCDL